MTLLFTLVGRLDAPRGHPLASVLFYGVGQGIGGLAVAAETGTPDHGALAVEVDGLHASALNAYWILVARMIAEREAGSATPRRPTRFSEGQFSG